MDQNKYFQEELDWWNNVDLKLNTTNCSCCIHNSRKIINRMEFLMDKLGIESARMQSRKMMFENVHKKLSSGQKAFKKELGKVIGINSEENNHVSKEDKHGMD